MERKLIDCVHLMGTRFKNLKDFSLFSDSFLPEAVSSLCDFAFSWVSMIYFGNRNASSRNALLLVPFLRNMDQTMWFWRANVTVLLKSRACLLGWLHGPLMQRHDSTPFATALSEASVTMTCNWHEIRKTRYYLRTLTLIKSSTLQYLVSVGQVTYFTIKNLIVTSLKNVRSMPQIEKLTLIVEKTRHWH